MIEKPPTHEQCPVCIENVREDFRERFMSNRRAHALTHPARRFRSHDIGFYGRSRSDNRREICPASGMTIEEAKLIAHKIRVGAVGAPVIGGKP